MPLRALATVNLDAVRDNATSLRVHAGSAALCAVVKADGYGHGATQVARAALAGGAQWLAVATADEAATLRAAGIAPRILVMGALSREELDVALAADADVVAWTPEFVDQLRRSPAAAGPVRAHVKLDTGMGRLGTRSPTEAVAVAEAILDAGAPLELAGAMTHFATADADPEFTAGQLAQFEPFVAQIRRRAPSVMAHAANSAATLREPRAHLDMVRCGIALYGLDPFGEDPAARQLRPALTLRSYLAAVKRADPGQSAGYGRRFIAERPTWIGTVPIGYGDGVRRVLSPGGEVLVAGRRYPLAGTVSMDNITVDLGSDLAPGVEVGAPVTMIGADGNERILAEELATWANTLNYEIVCGISPRVPRRYEAGE